MASDSSFSSNFYGENPVTRVAIPLTCSVFCHSYSTFHGFVQDIFIFQTCLLEETIYGFKFQLEHWLLGTWITLSMWSNWTLTLYPTQVPWLFPDLCLWPIFPLSLHCFCPVYTVSSVWLGLSLTLLVYHGMEISEVDYRPFYSAK